MFVKLLNRGLFGVGMLEHMAKIYFRYRKRQMNVKLLYQLLPRSKWPTAWDLPLRSGRSIEVDGQIMPVKLDFITNPGDANQYLMLATTEIGMRAEEIVRMYGRRW